MMRRLILLTLAVLAGCAVEPQPIQLGAEECAHCRMAVTELRFAGQALNTKGRAYSFDAVECLAEAINAGAPVAAADLHSAWVADFSEPERWVRAEEAFFLRSDRVRSPMGVGLTAHATEEAAKWHRAELGGEVMRWSEVLRLVGGGGHGGHAHAEHAREQGR